MFNNATLVSENYGMSIGDSRTVDYTFTTTIGDPKKSSEALNPGSSIGGIQMNASGVYELTQVFQTVLATDVTNYKFNDVAYGHAIAANDDVLVIGASGFQAKTDFSVQGTEVGMAYIYKNNKGFYTQIQQTSGSDSIAEGLNNTEYLPTGSDGANELSNADFNFGMDVAVSSQNIIAIGSTRGGISGTAVSLLHPNEDSTNWVVRDVLTGIIDDAADDVASRDFGSNIAFDKELSGTTQWMAIGNPSDDQGNSGDIGVVHVRYGTKGDTNSFVGYQLLPVR